MKKDKSIKTALDSRKLNDITIKGKHKCQAWKNSFQGYQGRNEKTRMENFKNKDGFRLCIWTDKTRREVQKPMHFHRYWRRVHRILPFLKRILRTGRYLNNLPRTDRQNFGHKSPAWLDDIIIITKGDIKKHVREVCETMKKLVNTGYTLNLKNCEFFLKEIE